MSFQDTLAFLLNPKTQQKAADVMTQLNKAGQVYKKVEETKKTGGGGPALTPEEKKIAEKVYQVKQILNKPQTPIIQIDKTGRTEAEATKIIEENQKYGKVDFLSNLASKALPKFAKPLVKEAARGVQDVFTTPKGYTSEEVAAYIVGKKDMNYWQKVDAIRNPNDYLITVSGTEKQEAIDAIKKVKQKAYEDYIKPPTQEELRENFIERGLAPMDQTSMESLKGVIGGTVGGVASGLTLGISDVLRNATGIDQAMQEPPRQWKEEQLAREQRQMEPTYKAFTQIAPQASSVIGGFIGGAGTYSAIASKIGSKLQTIKGPIGQTLARHPVLTTYLVQNPLEEVVEGVVRKSTGQQYGVSDFLWGLGMGTVFSSLGLGRVKQDAVSRNVEAVLKEAEVKKGSVLTPQEFQETILNAKLLGKQTGRDLMTKAGYMFGENRLVYKTGKGAMPEKKLPDRYEDSPSAGEFGKYQALAPEIKFEGKDGMKLIRDKATAEVLGVRNRLGQTKMFETGEINTGAIGKKIMEQRLKDKKIAEGKLKEGIMDKAKKLAYKVETGFFDKAAYIDNVIRKAYKQHKITELEANVFKENYEQSLRHAPLTDKLAQDIGFVQAAKAVDNIDEAGQYFIAKHKLDVATHKKYLDDQYENALGTSKAEDQAIVNAYEGKYSQDLQKYKEMNDLLLTKGVEYGLFKPKDIEKLRKIYPNYVPLIRIGKKQLKELDKNTLNFAEGSLSGQSILKELEGSKLAVQNPYESMLHRMSVLVREGEKNNVAKALAGYADLPGFEKEIWKLNPGQKAEYQITYLKDGEPVKMGVSKEFYDFAQGADVSKIAPILNLTRSLMRGFKAGTTALNPAFLLKNVVRDIQTAKVNSKFGVRLQDIAVGLGSNLKTSFSRGLKKIGINIKEGKLESKYRELGGSGTQTNLLMKDTAKTLQDIVGIKKAGGPKVLKPFKYLVKGVKEFRNAVESIVNLSEQATRLGVFRRNIQGYMKKGTSKNEATKLALQEALDATANFIRGGRFKSVITGLYPYQSAGFAGARSLQKSLKRSPAKTIMRIAAYTLLPEAGTVAWNLADPNRRKIYEDIQNYEKDTAYIIISPWAKWNEAEGRYEGVYKLPKPAGIAAISVPIRKEIEKAVGTNPDGAGVQDWLNSIADPAFGVQFQPGIMETMGNYIPHPAKIPIEIAANHKFWGNKEIVPKWMLDKPVAEQKYDWTPEEYQWLGAQLGMSPLVIEHIIKGYGGSGAEQLIGAKDPLEEISKGFVGATGGAVEQREKAQEEIDKVLHPGTSIKTKTFNRTRTF